MSMKLFAIALPIALVFPAASEAAEPKAEHPDLIDVSSATCAQFSRAQSFAKPPKNPSAQQTQLAELAQDDLILAMTWANGYLSARDGRKQDHAFTRQWIVTHMGKLNAICDAGPATMSLAEAVGKL